MAEIILVTGGSRSGKSDYAQNKAELQAGNKLFIATCPASVDSELADRIEKHKNARLGKGWQTLEEEVDLVHAISSNHAFTTLLIDCLTLWINNLMYHSQLADKSFSESDVSDLCQQVIDECHRHPGVIFFVTNEVGSGIVPDSANSRLYRDLVGRCNQQIAKAADQVVLVSCGIPLSIKS